MAVTEELGPILPKLLKEFESRYPATVVDVRVASSEQVLHIYGSGDVDVALHIFPGEAASGTRLVGVEPLVWVGAPAGSAPFKDPLPLALSTSSQDWCAQALLKLNGVGKGYRIALSSATAASVAAIVSADLAIAPMLRCLVPERLMILSDRSLPSLPALSLAIATREDSAPGVALADFLAFRLGASAGECLNKGQSPLNNRRKMLTSLYKHLPSDTIQHLRR
ncbi:LysR substrate-binding domain-containing protein (plasmid) [Rhizobium leguminosarum]